jgi:hypothetical protein
MNYISWNCRGLVVASKMNELQALCEEHKPSLIYLTIMTVPVVEY